MILFATSFPASNAKLLAPIPRPRKNVFGIGLNYTEHVAESARSLDTSAELPQEPVIFSKAAHRRRSHGTTRLSHNAEGHTDARLGVRTGGGDRRAGTRMFRQEDALDHMCSAILVINDVSCARLPQGGAVDRLQRVRTPLRLWVPAIVTADEIPDPQTPQSSKPGSTVSRSRMATANYMLFSVKRVDCRYLLAVMTPRRRRYHRHRHACGRRCWPRSARVYVAGAMWLSARLRGLGVCAIRLWRSDRHERSPVPYRPNRPQLQCDDGDRNPRHAARARGQFCRSAFTFHSARMRMKKVTKEELAAMDAAF